MSIPMCLFVTYHLSTANGCIGRIDRESLPQQSLMELLIGGITQRKEVICGVDEGSPISTLKGVIVNDEGNVTYITWNINCMKGTFDTKWILSTVESFRLSVTEVSGSADLRVLPIVLKHLHLSQNWLSGTLDLTSLTESLRKLQLSFNRFSGEISLTSLP